MHVSRTAFVLTIGILLVFPNGAHDVITTKLTYTRDISRIFAERCSSCHGSGASIPLMSYQQVRPWAVDIKEQVLSRRMPPWGAVKGFGNITPDEGLTEEELLIIARWVVGGSPEGNPALLPSPTTSDQKPKLAALQDGLEVKQSRRLTNRSCWLASGPSPPAKWLAPA